jgi:hypothetical protein
MRKIAIATVSIVFLSACIYLKDKKSFNKCENSYSFRIPIRPTIVFKKMRLNKWYNYEYSDMTVSIFLFECEGKSKCLVKTNDGDTICSGWFISADQLDSIGRTVFNVDTGDKNISYEKCYYPIKNGVWKYFDKGILFKTELWENDSLTKTAFYN